MNLAFAIFKYYPFGGLERNFLRVTEECLKRGHSVTVYTMNWHGEVPAHFANYDFHLKVLSVRGFSNHIRCRSFGENLRNTLQNETFDLLVGFNRMPGLDLYYCADVCFKADVRRRHGLLYRLTSRYRVYSSMEKAVFSPDSHTRVMVLSHIQKAVYQQEYGTPPSRFCDIPPGIDKHKIRDAVKHAEREKIRAALGLKENTQMLLMVGSDFRRKGVMRTLKAAASLPEEKRARIKLFIVGKGKVEKYAYYAKKYDIDTVFTGGVDNVQEYYSAADLLIHPAVSENTGNAIVEALISGTPVIATSNCGYAFHIENSNAGMVVDGDNFSQEHLNSALNAFLEYTADEQKKLSINALEYSDKTDLYSRPQVIADIIEQTVSEKVKN